MIKQGEWYSYEIGKIGLDGNMEINYDKMQQAITQGILTAQRISEESEQKKHQLDRKRIVIERLNNLGLTDDFDDEGNPRNRRANVKFFWKFLWAKETQLKDIHVLSETVNGIISSVFLLIEWFLYILAVFLIGQGAIGMVNCCLAESFNWTSIISYADFVLYGTICFLFARTLIRLMKIECINNKDSNYMLNFLAVIIAIAALLVSIFKKSG